MRILLFTAALLAAVATSLSSCYSDPEPGNITITVLDAQDFRVSEAEVRFFQSGNGSGQIDVTDTPILRVRCPIHIQTLGPA